MEVLFIVVFALVICVVVGAHKVDMLRRDFTYLEDRQDFSTMHLDKVNRKMYALEKHLQLKYVPETTVPAHYKPTAKSATEALIYSGLYSLDRENPSIDRIMDMFDKQEEAVKKPRKAKKNATRRSK